jgi:hypothetical protein
MSVESSDCQNPSPYPATILSYPWRGTEYDDDKSKFFKFVRSNRYHGHPTRLIDAVKHVYGGDYDEAERRRLSRLANRCDWFSTNSAPGYVEVEPTLACFQTGGLELRSNQNKKRPEGDGIGFDTSQTGTVQYPKDRVQSILDKRVRLDGGQYGGMYKQGNDYRSEILRELAQYRSDIEDKYTIFKRLRGQGKEYLLQPCLNRFNDTGRATESRQRVETALQRASGRYNHGAELTLTPDPNRFESHAEATQALSDNVANLMQTLRYRLGFSPKNIKVLEFQKNGLPHYHIVLFGVRVVEGETETGKATISTEEVREYWDTKRDMGSQVDVSPVYCRGDKWILHEDSDCTVSLSYYLTKEISDLITVAETDPEALFDKVESGDVSLWRQALYWAYDKQYTTCSPSLKESKDKDALVIWEYVGTAKYEQIPSQIVDNAVLCRSQPPP